MRNVLLIVLLVGISTRAGAQWAQVVTNELGTSYADPATIRKDGDMVKMWELLDFKAVQARPYGRPYMSQKTQREYDCMEQRTRTVESLQYSENMGQGDITHADTEAGQWEAISPDAARKATWRFACGRQ